MMKNKKYSDLELRIATDEVAIISLYNTIKDIVKSIDKKAKVEDFDKWYKDCEKGAIKILESQKESENNGK